MKNSWLLRRPRAARFAFLGIDEHEVDVGRHVELAAAELAHADHVQLLRQAAVFSHRLPVFRRQPALEVCDRGRDCDVGERGDRSDDFVQRRQSAQIARDYPQHHALAQVPQRALERRFVRGIRGSEQRAHLPALNGARTLAAGSRPGSASSSQRAKRDNSVARADQCVIVSRLGSVRWGHTLQVTID